MGYLFSLQATNLNFIQDFLQSLIMLYDSFALCLNKTYSLGLAFSFIALKTLQQNFYLLYPIFYIKGFRDF